eukprot:TRINITY_DN1511_c0_g1_i2.p1 TRINITY_DN1511_c0_g1~~TRINITY_DN1511_c0_g1_i2.p1  ORF type:complete len:415 (-),score=125.19 TRINITY_DN1511_c0_g1_i2:483-1688(-)
MEPKNNHAATSAALLENAKKGTVSVTEDFQNAFNACKEEVERIIAECQAQGTQYTDEAFDVVNSPFDCLYIDPNNRVHPGMKDLDSYIKDWKRLSEIFPDITLFYNSTQPGDIRQGRIGDCWFLGGLSAVAASGSVREKNIVAHDCQVGVYGFLFFKNGAWTPVVVDDYVPVGQDGLPILAKCKKGEVWVSIIEKAFAKLHLHYEAINSGHGNMAIEDLTGGISSIFLFKNLKPEAVWQKLNNKTKIYCVSKTGQVVEEKLKDGLIARHLYGVLRTAVVGGHKLVQMRNPWGHTEWNGAWSDASPLWTPAFKQQVNFKAKNDGKFWMSLEDFCAKWELLAECRLFTETWTLTTAASDSPKAQFKLTVDQDNTTVVLNISNLMGELEYGLRATQRPLCHSKW